MGAERGRVAALLRPNGRKEQRKERKEESEWLEALPKAFFHEKECREKVCGL